MNRPHANTHGRGRRLAPECAIERSGTAKGFHSSTGSIPRFARRGFHSVPAGLRSRDLDRVVSLLEIVLPFPAAIACRTAIVPPNASRLAPVSNWRRRPRSAGPRQCRASMGGPEIDGTDQRSCSIFAARASRAYSERTRRRKNVLVSYRRSAAGVSVRRPPLRPKRAALRASQGSVPCAPPKRKKGA
jgi:hypothetical protein